MKLFQTSEPSSETIDEMIAYTLMRYAAYSHLEREYKAAVETLQHFHTAGAKIALVTSRNLAEVAELRSNFRGVNWVDTIVCACDVENPKPAGDSALLALKTLGVGPENAVFIGDSVFDMRCAKSAGVSAVAVTYGAGRKEDLLAEQPDLVIDSPDELLAWAQELLPTPCLERKN